MTDQQPPRYSAETAAIRAGRGNDGGALAPAIWATSTFVSKDTAEAHRMATSVGATGLYSRYGNPSVAAFESAVAELEGAEAARAFASGMGAISAVILGLCSSGDHIVTQRQLYGGTQMFFASVCPRFGIDVTFVDATDPEAWSAAIRPGKTMMCFAETPANPKLDLVDLAAFGAIAGPITVVDSTFAPPLSQRPLDYGVNLVLHSATKAIAGHNDATIGVVSGDQELIDWLWGFAVLQGACASPFDATNALRGIRTLPLRLRRQSESAMVIARFLEAHEMVTSVSFPGLGSHPQHELASRQMRYPGGLITFDVRGGAEFGRRVVESTKICQLATSLGGPETLVTHPASTTHVGLLAAELADAGIGPGTIRCSVGLEDAEDLIADVGRALERAAQDVQV